MFSRIQKNGFQRMTTAQRTNGVAMLLFFTSAAAYATANGIIQLPDTYRTPLSDLVQEGNKGWRTDPSKIIHGVKMAKS